jgi:hypothetical protein
MSTNLDAVHWLDDVALHANLGKGPGSHVH